MDSKENRTDRTPLFVDFPPITTEEWKEKIVKDLKGADYDRRLVWRTMEGFNVQPFYRNEDLDAIPNIDQKPGEFPFKRGTKKDNDWYVRQDIIVESVEKANATALDVLNRGVDALSFIFVNPISQKEFNTLLAGVELSAIQLTLAVHTDPKPFVEQLLVFAKANGVALNQVQGQISYAPLTGMMLTGNVVKNEQIETAKALIDCSSDLPNFRTFGVLASFYHNSGSTIVEELGLALAEGVEAMNLLTEAGVSAEDAGANLHFTFAVGGNYFMEIAKIRAARSLWAQVLKSYGIEENRCKMQIHTVSSAWNITIYDPYVNMLRTTTEAMSAAIGGADSHTVLPFDHAWKRSDEFSDRIARNQQLLLKEESHFDKVVDPSAGSYYIETLTQQIANHAWSNFLAIEEKGGFIAAAKAGVIQDMLAATAQKRDLNIATRKESILGINQFPNFTEKIDAGVEIDKKGCCCNEDEEREIKTIKPYRGAVAFEKMRFVTDKYSETNKRPRVFMLTIGNLTMRKARAQFSSNFFACAGFEVKDNNGFATIDEGITAAKAYEADIVVLCSSDAEYETFAPELLEKLNKNTILVVAGFPKALMDMLKEKGVTNFIHVKTNVLETLLDFQKQLGVK